MVIANNTLDVETKLNLDVWLKGDIDPSVKEEIYRLLEENPKEIVDSLYTKLAFGTGGLRGVMGIGSNRMNPYTVRMATQGLANHINRNQSERCQGVFIGFDSRRHSKEYAEEAAKGRVLSTDELLDLWVQQSLCYRDLKKMDQSMLILSRVINYDAISSLRLKAMYLRAEIYELQGRQELARKQLDAIASKGGDWAKKAKIKLEEDYDYQ